MKPLIIFLLGLNLSFAGSVKFLVGDCTINGKKARVGSKIKKGDTLQVNAESGMDIVFKNGAKIRIKENSNLVIHSFNENELKPSANLELVNGKLLTMTKKKSDVNVHTTIASASVRGTIFFTRVDNRGTYFCTCNGSVKYKSKNSEKTLKAVHHGAILFGPDGKFKTSTMDDHTDLDIFELMAHE